MPFKGYRKTSSYGYRTHPKTGVRMSFHAGIDLVKLTGGKNAPIEAFTAGTVVYAGWGKNGTGLGSYGNVVLIRDKNGRGQLYAHLNSVAVKTGQAIKKGQKIGNQGDTPKDKVTGAHLHFEVRKKLSPSHGWTSDKANSTIDPTKYLKSFNGVLTIDGKWGKDTTKALQRYFGTPVDGIISKQSRNAISQSLYGNTVQFNTGGSVVIRALQKLLGVTQDGLLGPTTVRALQKRLGTVVDGKLSRPSLVIKELQRRLNAGSI